MYFILKHKKSREKEINVKYIFVFTRQPGQSTFILKKYIEKSQQSL